MSPAGASVGQYPSTSTGPSLENDPGTADMQANKERAAEITLCCALTCVAGAADADFFSGWQFAVPVVGGAAVPAPLAAAATERGWRPGGAAMVGAVLLPVAAVALLLVLPGTGASSVGDAAGTVLDGTVGGWAAMLAAGLPADLHGDLLVTPLAFSWQAPRPARSPDRRPGGVARPHRRGGEQAAGAGRRLPGSGAGADAGAGRPGRRHRPERGAPGRRRALPGGARELAERGPAPHPGRPGRVRCTPRRGDRGRQPAGRRSASGDGVTAESTHLFNL